MCVTCLLLKGWHAGAFTIYNALVEADMKFFRQSVENDEKWPLCNNKQAMYEVWGILKGF
ncbi:MAG TPA: hypothetical protein DIW24_05355 [Bacteroidetes bacterium]|nr:hypothetical protein [Bacteroidota bacterium]